MDSRDGAVAGEKVEVLVTVEVDGKKYIENGMLSSVNHGQWETIYDRYEIDVYGRDRNSKIIAWMPLPQPWKGEDNDKCGPDAMTKKGATIRWNLQKNYISKH